MQILGMAKSQKCLMKKIAVFSGAELQAQTPAHFKAAFPISLESSYTAMHAIALLMSFSLS